MSAAIVINSGGAVQAISCCAFEAYPQDAWPLSTTSRFKSLSHLQARGDVVTALVTGNLEPIGWAKMESLGIKHLFTEPYFGGFGSDYCNPDNSDQSWRDRAELVKIAAQKAHKLFPGTCIMSLHNAGQAPVRNLLKAVIP